MRYTCSIRGYDACCAVVVRRFNTRLPHISGSLTGATFRCFFSHPHHAPAHRRVPDDLRVSRHMTRYIRIGGVLAGVLGPDQTMSSPHGVAALPVAAPGAPSHARTGQKRKRTPGSGGTVTPIDPRLLQQQVAPPQPTGLAFTEFDGGSSEEEDEQEGSQSSSVPRASSSLPPLLPKLEMISMSFSNAVTRTPVAKRERRSIILT